jgi:hypothetical protein
LPHVVCARIHTTHANDGIILRARVLWCIPPTSSLGSVNLCACASLLYTASTHRPCSQFISVDVARTLRETPSRCNIPPLADPNAARKVISSLAVSRQQPACGARAVKRLTKPVNSSRLLTWLPASTPPQQALVAAHQRKGTSAPNAANVRLHACVQCSEPACVHYKGDLCLRSLRTQKPPEQKSMYFGPKTT